MLLLVAWLLGCFAVMKSGSDCKTFEHGIINEKQPSPLQELLSPASADLGGQLTGCGLKEKTCFVLRDMSFLHLRLRDDVP